MNDRQPWPPRTAVVRLERGPGRASQDANRLAAREEGADGQDHDRKVRRDDLLRGRRLYRKS
jgi:hypothetical protein